jgi:hypothetical protein
MKQQLFNFLILLTLILFNSCTNNVKLLNNGLTKKATQTKEYTIDHKTKDTLRLLITSFNNFNKIKNTIHHIYDYKAFNKAIYRYKNKQLQQIEEYDALDDTIPTFTNYFYKDSLLIKTVMKAPNGGYKTTSTFSYDEHILINKRIISQYFDDKTEEVIGYSAENFRYKDGVNFITSKLTNQFYPEENKTFKYAYNSYNLATNYETYDYKNKLIEETSYTYKYDKFNNWIVKKQSINDTLAFIRTREIDYK